MGDISIFVFICFEKGRALSIQEAREKHTTNHKEQITTLMKKKSTGNQPKKKKEKLSRREIKKQMHINSIKCRHINKSKWIG